jgi:hypothetical protein
LDSCNGGAIGAAIAGLVAGLDDVGQSIANAPHPRPLSRKGRGGEDEMVGTREGLLRSDLGYRISARWASGEDDASTPQLTLRARRVC